MSSLVLNFFPLENRGQPDVPPRPPPWNGGTEVDQMSTPDFLNYKQTVHLQARRGHQITLKSGPVFCSRSDRRHAITLSLFRHAGQGAALFAEGWEEKHGGDRHWEALCSLKLQVECSIIWVGRKVAVK